MVDPIRTAMAPDMLRDIEAIMRVKYPALDFEEGFYGFYMNIVSVAMLNMEPGPDPYEAWKIMQYNVFATVFITGWESALLALARRPAE